jgi:hypothetical protein
MPNEETVSPDQVKIHNLEVGDVIHISIEVGDVDTRDNDRGVWFLSPEGTATVDVVLDSLRNIWYIGKPVFDNDRLQSDGTSSTDIDAPNCWTPTSTPTSTAPDTWGRVKRHLMDLLR